MKKALWAFPIIMLMKNELIALIIVLIAMLYAGYEFLKILDE